MPSTGRSRRSSSRAFPWGASRSSNTGWKSLAGFCSDGLAETFDGGREPLGYEPIARALADHATESAESILRALRNLGESWSGGSEIPTDDVTLVVVKRR